MPRWCVYKQQNSSLPDTPSVRLIHQMVYTPEWFTYFAIFCLVVGSGLIAALGWFDKGQSLVKKAPWLEKFLSRKGALEVLLLGVLVFLIIDGIRLYQSKSQTHHLW